LTVAIYSAFIGIFGVDRRTGPARLSTADASRSDVAKARDTRLCCDGDSAWKWTATGRMRMDLAAANAAAAGLAAASRRIVGLLAALTVGCLLAATAASAQGTVRSVHDDWQIRCENPPGAQNEQCALFQSVVAEDRANVGLTVLVLKTADAKSRLMRIQAPLGVLLPAGLGLKIDNVDVGRAGFVRCLPRGCYAEVVMDDELVKKLRNGTSATFFIFQTPEEGIGFPVSLKGFGAGYDKLP
jgi:invasion protein IalB